MGGNEGEEGEGRKRRGGREGKNPPKKKPGYGPVTCNIMIDMHSTNSLL